MVPYIEDGVELQKAAAEAGKKNVFLIGDSLRMGYCETVKTDLSDVANVFYPAENCRNSQYIITCLRTWSTLCDPKTVDLVHFNCGHWDAAHWNGAPVSLTPLPVYGENLRALVWQLRHIFPNAAVTFATSTPMSPNAVQGVNPRSNEELRAYNETAREALRGLNVPIDDLFSVVEPWDASHFADYCHLTPEAFAELGHAVSRFLRGRL